MAEAQRSGLILGIESSCDETAAAVVRHGREVLSNVVASQISLHANYGGVVPELASREHLRNIVPVVQEAVVKAGVRMQELDAVAVTEGPGLAGALLVGIVYAQALAFALRRPTIAVNHIEGHIHAVLMQSQPPPAGHPLLALVVSGGHTHLYLAHTDEAGAWHYRNVGRTIDDAAGEAYDKVGKMLGLGYPGGPWIDALAPLGNAHAIRFNLGNLKNLEAEPRFDFSFSGVKTAVLRYVQANHMSAAIETRRLALATHTRASAVADAGGLFDQRTLDVIASFQHAVIGNLLQQTFAAGEMFGVRALLVSGGVAANAELRSRFLAEGARRNLPVAFPTPALSTDNAAMIAAAGWSKFRAGSLAPPAISAAPQLRLG